MLIVKNLVKNFKNKKAVNDLSFTVNKGEVFALLGNNGAGKTTTIKMILGLLKIDGGTIEVQDGVQIGYSPDTPYFPPFLTGRETLEYYAGISKMDKATRNERITLMLKTVGLEDSKTKVSKYSKGMTQRLALAQALLEDPELLILDEPTAGLDALGRIEIIELIKRLKEMGKTIVLNSHILSDIERVCDRGIIMKDGVCLGTWEKNADKEKSLQDLFIELMGGLSA